MSNTKSPQVDNKNTESEDEEKGFLSLEAKAGLSLICILACGFSFMVWQQWKHQKSDQVASTEEQQTAEQKTGESKPAPKQKPKKSAVAKSASSEPDPFAEQSEPPVKTSSVPAKEISLSENSPGEDPFTSPNSNSRPPKADIPTLEVPQESPATITVLPTEKDEPESKTEVSPFDPFGDEVVADRSDSQEPPQKSPTAQSDAFDPFGPAMQASDKKSTASEEKEPTQLPSLDGTAVPEEKIVELDAPDASSAISKTDDPFAAGVNPFEDKPSAKNDDLTTTATEGKSTSSNEEPDPFAEPEETTPAIMPQQSEEKVASDANEFQDPLPILEPVPAKKEKSPATNPFGEFESIPAGSAQASSVTTVSPEFTREKPRGSLAELDSQSKSDPLLMTDDPFSEPTVTAKRDSKPFHLQADGTYQVQDGDSYWNISRDAYGTPLYYRALAEFNSGAIPSPENMTAGTKIQIPSTAELERQYPKLVAKKSSAGTSNILKTSAEDKQEFFSDESGTPIYRVRKNDTLTSIAQEYLGRASRWIQIYKLNRQTLTDPNKLKIGTLLKLPRDASRVKIVGE